MTASPTLSAEELAEYLLDLGGALLSYGCPTHRLEALIAEICALEGYQAEAFAVPTGLWMTLRAPGREPIARMVRVKEWGVELDRLVAIDRIFNDVLERKLTLAEARAKLDEVEARPLGYPRALAWVAAGGASGAAAIFFRGGWREAGLAAIGGALVGMVRSLLRRSARARLLEDFLGGVLAAAVAWGATAVDPRLSREVLVLSVVILLVPGMALTSGISELAHKNLVSGASRLMEAFMTFLSILIGIAVVVGIERLIGLGGMVAGAPRGAAPVPVQVAALLVAALGFGVLFSVPRPLLYTAILSGAVAWIATGLGTHLFPGSLVAFAASFVLALYANGLARGTNRPAQLHLLPGLVLLVPGSFGFRSLESFLRGELAGGASEGFEMFLVAGAIVTGFLCANVVLPARKLL